MGTEKRERQKAGRAARVEAAMAAQKKAESRRRIWWVVGTVAFVAVVLGVLAFVTRDDGDDTASSNSTTTSLPDPTTSEQSVAGQPCVALSDPLPDGAPTISIPEGEPPTELVVTDIVEGTGDPIPSGATVTVHYTGVSCSTGAIFDSSYTDGEPVSFPLTQVIPGWQEGIPGMKVGGQRLLGIPPDMAYGQSPGRPPKVGVDETLWFLVEAEGFEPAGTASSTPAG